MGGDERGNMESEKRKKRKEGGRWKGKEKGGHDMRCDEK